MTGLRHTCDRGTMSDCSDCPTCKIRTYLDTTDKPVRAFFCVKQSRSGDVGTMYSTIFSDIPKDIWDDAMKLIVLSNLEDLKGLRGHGCLGQSMIILPKHPKRYKLRFTYMGSSGRNPQEHCFMFDTIKNDVPQHTKPSSEPEHDPM